MNIIGSTNRILCSPASLHSSWMEEGREWKKDLFPNLAFSIV